MTPARQRRDHEPDLLGLPVHDALDVLHELAADGRTRLDSLLLGRVDASLLATILKLKPPRFDDLRVVQVYGAAADDVEPPGDGEDRGACRSTCGGGPGCQRLPSQIS